MADRLHSGQSCAEACDAAAPRRVQLSRKKGWRLPVGSKKVDRSTRWGNWHRVGQAYDARPTPTTAAEAVAEFRRDVLDMLRDDPGRTTLWLAPLRGKSLACWCPLDAPCHADVLLELANQEVT